MIQPEKIAHFLILSVLAAFTMAAADGTNSSTGSNSGSATNPTTVLPETQTPHNHTVTETGSTAEVLEACGDRDDCFSKITDIKLTDSTNPGQSHAEKAARSAAEIAHGTYHGTQSEDGTNK